MAAEQDLYEGRKGKKRLKNLEKKIEDIKDEFEDKYRDSQEMRFLREEISWEKKAELVFALAYRDVNFKWKGLRDYGFIRLSREWLMEQEAQKADTDMVLAMAKDILPSGMYSDLRDELTEIETEMA